MAKRNLLPGVFDILPQDEKEPWRSSYLWRQVEEEIYQTTDLFGFREIRFPILEKSELFERGVGSGTDIVNKEMYTFEDRGGRQVSLRPEGTAPAMRAFVDGDLAALGSTHKLFYIGPMFRYERSQAGRYRQHHQFGVEAIGPASAEQDAEVIDLIITLFNRLGLKDLKLWINTLGKSEERKEYRNHLQAYLEKHKRALSEESQKRVEINPLRVLDSKAEEDQEIIKQAPILLDHIGKESLKEFEALQELLRSIGIDCNVKPNLVRGLDYYNNTVFEVTADVLGAQNSLVGGGRYDGLMKTVGGPDLPAIGFGCGLERVIQTMLKQMVSGFFPPSPTLFLIALDDKARREGFQLLHELHAMGISAQMDYSSRKLNKIMNSANQLRARYVVVIGEREIEERTVSMKTMATGEERKIPLSQLGSLLKIEQEKSALMDAIRPFSHFGGSEMSADLLLNTLSEELSQTQKITGDLQKAVAEIDQLLESKQDKAD